MRLAAALALLSVVALLPGKALALEHDAGALPACASPLALTLLRDRFAHDQAIVWRTGLYISRVTAVVSAGVAKRPNEMLRRYCRANSILNNGSRPSFLYVIDQPLGSFDPSLSYCVLARVTGEFGFDGCDDVRKPGTDPDE